MLARENSKPIFFLILQPDSASRVSPAPYLRFLAVHFSRPSYSTSKPLQEILYSRYGAPQNEDYTNEDYDHVQLDQLTKFQSAFTGAKYHIELCNFGNVNVEHEERNVAECMSYMELNILPIVSNASRICFKILADIDETKTNNSDWRGLIHLEPFFRGIFQIQRIQQHPNIEFHTYLCRGSIEQPMASFFIHTICFWLLHIPVWSSSGVVNSVESSNSVENCIKKQRLISVFSECWHWEELIYMLVNRLKKVCSY